MMNKLSLVFMLFVITCCGDVEKPIKTEASSKITKSDILSQIELLSDSLMSMNIALNTQNKLEKNARIALKSKMSVVTQQLINENLSYINNFPQDTMAPYCFQNVKLIYSQIQAYEKSLSYMDSILVNYPDFIYYSDVLEEKAGTLDFFITPRDTAIIRDAYEELLSLPNLSKSKIEIYNERLTNLDKDFSEIIP